MNSVSTTPMVSTSIKFRRAALAVKCSVKANNVMRRNTYFQVETKPEDDKAVIEAPKTETLSVPRSNASVKFRRAAVAVQFTVLAKKTMTPPPVREEPIIEVPQVEVTKEIVSTKPKTSVKFRRAALAVQYALNANRTIQQPHYYSKFECTSQNETQNILEEDCIEEAPVENASKVVTAIVVEKARLTAEEDAEFEAPLPARRSCLKSTFSPKVKSVTMSKHARIRKTPSRSSYTQEMIESIWYSRAELQKMQDKVARKMNRNGMAVQSFWPLEGVFVPPSRAAQVVAEKVARDERFSSSTSKNQRKVTFSPDTKGSDNTFQFKQKLPDFGSDMFPMLNIVQQVQVSNRAA